MPVNLSIKNVPDDLAERLRDRAKRSHRSLQGELMVILEEAVGDRGRMSPIEVLGMVRSLGVKTGDDAEEIVRTSRDGL
jgi:plasmid stability protein